MNEEFIQLLRQIVQEEITAGVFQNFWFYFGIFCFAFLAQLLSTYVTSFMRVKGENAATKDDLADLQTQLADTTKITESIRSSIQTQHAESASVNQLVREKMEAVIEKTFDLELWLEQVRSRSAEGKLTDMNSSPMAKIEMLTTLYFPKCMLEMNHIAKAEGEIFGWSLNLAEKVRQSDGIPQDFNADLETLEPLHRELYRALREFREKLIDSYSAKVGLKEDQ